jgi:hypothetical protein
MSDYPGKKEKKMTNADITQLLKSRLLASRNSKSSAQAPILMPINQRYKVTEQTGKGNYVDFVLSGPGIGSTKFVCESLAKDMARLLDAAFAAGNAKKK